MLRRTPAGREAIDLARGKTPVVPAHFDAEVLSAVGRLHRAGDLDVERVEAILSILERSPFIRYELRPLLGEAWTLRHNLSLRDALYVALARRVGGSLLTADGRLARAPGLGIDVKVVGAG